MTIISLVLVVSGLFGVLFTRQSWPMTLVFAGMFGPFLLRELGLLRWRDDFQREAVMRSGMHALVAVGVLLTISALMEGPGTLDLNHPPIGAWGRLPAGLILTVAGLAWGLSWLLQFWGVRTGSFRILLWTMATITAIQVIMLVFQMQNDLPINWRVTAMAGLYLLAGWALVPASRRWPRVTGALLIGLVVLMLRMVVEADAVAGHQAAFFGFGLVVLPFLVPSVALLVSRDEGRETGSA